MVLVLNNDVFTIYTGNHKNISFMGNSWKYENNSNHIVLRWFPGSDEWLSTWYHEF